MALRNDPLVALYLTPTAKPQVVEKPTNPYRQNPYESPPKGGGKGKGKGTKGSKSSPPMPKELRGKWHRTPGGPICYMLTIQQVVVSKMSKLENVAQRVTTFAWSPNARNLTV